MVYTGHGILQARLLEWVAFPFSRGSSQPRDQTQVSCIAGRFFTSWDTREAHHYHLIADKPFLPPTPCREGQEGQVPLSMKFFPGKNTGVGCHVFLQGSSRPRDRTHISYVSCLVGQFFTDEPSGKPLFFKCWYLIQNLKKTMYNKRDRKTEWQRQR